MLVYANPVSTSTCENLVSSIYPQYCLIIKDTPTVLYTYLNEKPVQIVLIGRLLEYIYSTGYQQGSHTLSQKWCAGKDTGRLSQLHESAGVGDSISTTSLHGMPYLIRMHRNDHVAMNL